MKTPKSTKCYHDNPEARRKHVEYQKRYNKSKKEKDRRVELNRRNRQSHRSGKTSVGDGKDVSHTRYGIRLKSQSINRGSKSDQPGDKRARG